ncbi:MAG: UDP-N-acetylmuramoyl-L-alanine--D-glutamate ligase [Patescibacteria group bacterium]|nr:UDP-N-acetylmuramoyl-L-alanine--D-glutamate ligase [Patescibacteria group bacterium]
MTIPENIISRLLTKKILILGLAKEGWSSYQFLRKNLPEKIIGLADQKTQPDLEKKWQDTINTDSNLKLHLGPDHLDSLTEYNLILKTPGIPSTLKPIKNAINGRVELSSNLELMLKIVSNWQEQEKKSLDVKLKKAPDTLFEPITIGVTGTKGKSTTASIIHHVLKSAGLDSVLVGNIGTPALDRINQITSKTKLVIEMSSHQLADLKLSPDIAVIQRITSEHLDYYQNQQEYVNSKKAITMYQKVNQYVIYDHEWPTTQQIANLSSGHHLNFSLEEKNDSLVYSKNNELVFRDKKGLKEAIIATSEVPLLGEHNLVNTMPSILIAKMFGLANKQIQQAISTFKPLPHRLELVTKKNGVEYYNDSMATMPDAAMSALLVFANQPIILLAGGHERNQDFVPLANSIVKHNVKSLILFPPTGERIWQEVEKILREQESTKPIDHHLVSNMDEAITIAANSAVTEDIVLLSPGAASFGCFANYQDRGEQFRRAVFALK